MLSRTADNLYWLARYMERADFLARIVEATQRLAALPRMYSGAGTEWESARWNQPGPPTSSMKNTQKRPRRWWWNI